MGGRRSFRSVFVVACYSVLDEPVYLHDMEVVRSLKFMSRFYSLMRVTVKTRRCLWPYIMQRSPVSYRFFFLHIICGPVCCMQRWWQLQERLLCPCRWKVIESDGQRRVWTTWQTKSDRLANKEGYKWLQSDGSWRILSAVVTVEAAAILALVSRSFLSLNCCRQIEKTWVCMVRKGKR